MIVYDKEQKQIVIPNGIGNINLFNNGVEAGYNEGYEQGQADVAANARVLNVTENGVYKSKYSDPIMPTTVTGVYADGTEFYNYAELNGKVFNTKIAATIDSRLEFWYKGDKLFRDSYDVIIGAGNRDMLINICFQVRYYSYLYSILWVEIGDSRIEVKNWDDTVWHHFIVSKAEGLWIDGEKKGDFSPTNTISGEFYINGIGYDTGGIKPANGCFGMIKIDDTIIIPTADGFLNTNTSELLEVVHSGGYTFTENVPTYAEGELYKTINVNVPDLNGSYDEGYAQGKIDGINEQKSKLESINITENGTYRKEDGYNEVVVNVADLNGSYDEGYNQGQADVAAKARVLEVTENGNYLSKFSDPIIPIMPTLVTGVFDDGTEFHSYAELKGKVFNTKIAGTVDSRLEFWFKGDKDNISSVYNVIIGAGNIDNNNCFQVRYDAFSNENILIEIGNSSIFISDWGDTVWHHLIISKAEGLWIDGEKKGDFSPSNTINGEFFINGIGYNRAKNANGTFGMIKINDVVIIPTANGFLNTNTGELLEVVQGGDYSFTENVIKYGEGELYKTINVNVIPKINVKEAGLKFSNSTFTEVPEWADFEGITDMSYMFRECRSLPTIPLLDTSKVSNMDSTFHSCENLETIPLLDTSNVTHMDNTFWFCTKLSNFPPIDTRNVTYMSGVFSSCNSLVSLPALDARSLNIPS